jgi:hypothetical protein
LPTGSGGLGFHGLHVLSGKQHILGSQNVVYTGFTVTSVDRGLWGCGMGGKGAINVDGCMV